MVEVPAMALRAGAAAPLVDFFSVGTNDLTQYTLAAERGNAAVAGLSDPLDPAVLRLVRETVAAAGGRRVAVCGDVAAEPAATGLLVGLGVSELSVTPAAIPAVKDHIRHVSLADLRGLATQAVSQESASAVRRLVASIGENVTGPV